MNCDVVVSSKIQSSCYDRLKTACAFAHHHHHHNFINLSLTYSAEIHNTDTYPFQ